MKLFIVFHFWHQQYIRLPPADIILNITQEKKIINKNLVKCMFSPLSLSYNLYRPYRNLFEAIFDFLTMCLTIICELC